MVDWKLPFSLIRGNPVPDLEMCLGFYGGWSSATFKNTFWVVIRLGRLLISLGVIMDTHFVAPFILI